MGTTTISPSPSSSINTRSTSPHHVESIISTRQRRQNAGNKLRQLLNNIDEPLLGYEDEDGHNIFQEVEDDHEYDVNATESEYEGDDDDNDENDNDSNNDEPSIDSKTRSRTRKASVKRRNVSKIRTRASKRQKLESDDDDDSESATANNDDDMFSDSSESEDSPDDDDSAGEKEYQSEQRAEARRNAKKKRDNFMPAAILKAQQRRARIDRAAKNKDSDSQKSDEALAAELDQQHQVKRYKLRMSADQLMSENRRRSTRKAAVKNAEDVLQRLKESEVRRVRLILLKLSFRCD